MCGRFAVITLPEALSKHFELEGMIDFSVRYNIAPTQPAIVIRCPRSNAPRQAVLMQWGLVPSWAKDPSIGQRMINARSETVAEKPAYRKAFQRRRCLVPADGYYEWQKPARGKGPKQPYLIRMKDERPFAMAGLWEYWAHADGSELETFTILTCPANELNRPIHDRMPVILPAEAYDFWLNPANDDKQALSEPLGPFPSHEMTARPITTRVNNPGANGPQLWEPVQPPPPPDGPEQQSLF